ncbi:MAG TPA: RbsD or FucU transport [Firmicutes bacterium]|nr:RbsD or FucU transport [Bacillota bacterium]
MLRGALLHPGILKSLGKAGHGSRVLIADGNYPFSTGSNPAADHVYLNLTPGIVSVTDVLKALVTAIPIEAAHVMVPPEGPEPPIFAEFREILGEGIELQPLGRFEFYDTARGQDTALVIATGEQRVWSNILLTIGVVPPPEA